MSPILDELRPSWAKLSPFELSWVESIRAELSMPILKLCFNENVSPLLCNFTLIYFEIPTDQPKVFLLKPNIMKKTKKWINEYSHAMTDPLFGPMNLQQSWKMPFILIKIFFFLENDTNEKHLLLRQSNQQIIAYLKTNPFFDMILWIKLFQPQ